MTCRYDREREEYLRDGEPCRTDDYGDPTRHCTSRQGCANHVGPDEQTCARCIGRTRQDIRVIVGRAPELMTQAVSAGVESEAANLAGPAADYRVFSARRTIAKAWVHANIHQSARGWCEDVDCQRPHFKTDVGDRWHKRGIENALADLIPDDDEHHPYGVLTRWTLMLAEDYGHPLPDVLTVSNSAAYLERILPRLAQDDEQDFPLFAREIRRCRAHLEAVLMDSQQPERGAPCPTCPQPAPKLNLERGHWCDDGLCERIHWPDDPDRWVCPRNREHWWTEGDYRRWVADVYEANTVGA